MCALDSEQAALQVLAGRIDLVRAQLAPIQSRGALLDSYRRESICRLASPGETSGSATEVLERAYAIRWLELESDTFVASAEPDRPFEPVDE